MNTTYARPRNEKIKEPEPLPFDKCTCWHSFSMHVDGGTCSRVGCDCSHFTNVNVCFHCGHHVRDHKNEYKNKPRRGWNGLDDTELVHVTSCNRCTCEEFIKPFIKPRK